MSTGSIPTLDTESGTILQPDTLYVVTQTIPTAEFQAFHWFLLLTDARGGATTYQWAEPKGGTGDAEERYIRVAERSYTHVTQNPSILGYFRVAGFEAAPMTMLENAEETSSFESAFENVFPVHYSTMHANREHGLSCRLWVLRVLAALQARGFLRGRADDVAAIEAPLKATSAAQEELLMKTLMAGKRFSAQVFTA